MKRIELHAITNYSMNNESTININELILKCAQNNEKGVALVDREGTLSFLKAEKILKELNIPNFKLIYGVELKLSYNNSFKKVVLLAKNRKGITSIHKLMTNYNECLGTTIKELLPLKKNLVIGLVYEENLLDEIIKHVDYVEVNSNVSKYVINELKTKTMVIYSNRINALNKEEVLSRKVLDAYLNKEDDIRIYENTEEALAKINDAEIVIDNPNKIFNLIEKFEVFDEFIMPQGNDLDIESLVYTKLSEKYKTDIPKKILKRVENELKLIRKYNYNGYLNIYKEITNICKSHNEEYVIYDYTSYLFIAYILGITHFDPIKGGLDYTFFFSNPPFISLKVSPFCETLIDKYLNKENINIIRCKGITTMNTRTLELAYKKYEKKYNKKLSREDKININKHLYNYPLRNEQHLSFKRLILPTHFNSYEISSYELVNDQYYAKTDYKDIENKFMMIELISSTKIEKLNQLKEVTNNYLTNCNYKDKLIQNRREYKEFLNAYDKFLILDDLYDELLSANVDITEVFTIINEIKKEKTISKKTKDTLKTHHINLKKYHNISFISRGVFNEMLRFEYTQLYFKEYYPLEYYYVMMNEQGINDTIEIVKKGYDEVVKNIKAYNTHRYEYKYLTLTKELFESNIDFVIEERHILEDYTFELDKENNKITLILKKQNSLIKKFLSNDISVIGTRPANGKLELLTFIINNLTNKSITIFGLDGHTNFYVEHLLAKITGIDKLIIRQYLNPCSCYKDKIFDIDENLFINGIKHLLTQNITIKDYNSLNYTTIENAPTLIDKLLYMINDADSEIIIIDNPDNLINDTYTLYNKVKTIAKEKNIHFIIFTTLKQEFETKKNNKSITFFKNREVIDEYASYITILDKEELLEIKAPKM